MSNYKYNGTGNNGTFAWLMQRISGIAIAVLGMVMFYQISTEGMHSMEAWQLFLVLIFGAWHTFSGFKMVTDDYIASAGKRFVLFLLYIVLGIITVTCGVLTLMAMV